MVALTGVGNGIAQFWWTRSLLLAPSSVVPFNYLLWYGQRSSGFRYGETYRLRACW